MGRAGSSRYPSSSGLATGPPGVFQRRQRGDPGEIEVRTIFRGRGRAGRTPRPGYRALTSRWGDAEDVVLEGPARSPSARSGRPRREHSAARCPVSPTGRRPGPGRLTLARRPAGSASAGTTVQAPPGSPPAGAASWAAAAPRRAGTSARGSRRAPATSRSPHSRPPNGRWPSSPGEDSALVGAHTLCASAQSVGPPAMSGAKVGRPKELLSSIGLQSTIVPSTRRAHTPPVWITA